eukprot:TRINITY_DN5346_c0_g1_i1.p1 TRINITY_DN5346_c0_g1~~TRINITY_DN5346_c0_g1_i1.p1  ORF type:complete len:309 (+),score=134.92 TRINITY_DN5346_c0_g1_i1:49-975(+)
MAKHYSSGDISSFLGNLPETVEHKEPEVTDEDLERIEKLTEVNNAEPEEGSEEATIPTEDDDWIAKFEEEMNSEAEDADNDNEGGDKKEKVKNEKKEELTEEQLKELAEKKLQKKKEKQKAKKKAKKEKKEKQEMIKERKEQRKKEKESKKREAGNTDKIEAPKKKKDVVRKLPQFAPHKTVHVKNLSFDVVEDDLGDLFEDSGDIERVYLQMNNNGRSAGFGYVEFTKESAVHSAIANMNNVKHKGRALKVEEYSSSMKYCRGSGKRKTKMLKQKPKNEKTTVKKKKIYQPRLSKFQLAMKKTSGKK